MPATRFLHFNRCRTAAIARRAPDCGDGTPCPFNSVDFHASPGGKSTTQMRPESHLDQPAERNVTWQPSSRTSSSITAFSAVCAVAAKAAKNGGPKTVKMNLELLCSHNKNPGIIPPGVVDETATVVKTAIAPPFVSPSPGNGPPVAPVEPAGGAPVRRPRRGYRAKTG